MRVSQLLKSREANQQKGYTYGWQGDRTMLSNMESDGEEYGNFDEDDFHQALSQASQTLPPLHQQRPAKRRRISSDVSGSRQGFVSENDEPVAGSSAKRPGYENSPWNSDDELSEPGLPKNERPSRTSPTPDLSGGEGAKDAERGNAEKRKKSKRLIHQPLFDDLPPPQISYASQLPSTTGEPGSSPSAIRGAKWLFKKPETTKSLNQRSEAVVSARSFQRSPAESSASRNGSNAMGLNSHQARLKQTTKNEVASLSAKTNVVTIVGNPVTNSNIGHGSFQQTGPSQIDLAHELVGLDYDDFASSQETERRVITLDDYEGTPLRQLQSVSTPASGLRQQTLFGGAAASEVRAVSQVNKIRSFANAQDQEPATHHQIDHEALKSWIYPTNLGAIRDYQFTIVSNALYNNTLVALPTGLGKTFIAATVMLNFFRWYPNAQMIFMAPTKPLVAQQVDACFNIAGIPRSTTTMLNGEITKALREEEWQDKRVFFMTPQTLDNDLRSGIADPKKIALLVVDEAHRATGNYAYVKVIEAIRKHNQSFRVLALTATPGADVEAVQAVIDNLGISKVEIRTEESIDIRPFVHRRDVDEIELEPSDEMIMVRDLFARAAQPLVDKICAQNAYYNKDPLSLTQYGLVQAMKSWVQSDAGRRAHQGLKFMMQSIFQLLISVSHALKLLNFHGMGPFHVKVKELRSSREGGGAKAGKFKSQLVDSADFKKMMDRIQMWISNKDFVGHPKLTYLCDTLLNHFMDADDRRAAPASSPSKTRAIVFCEYRESAEEITRILNRHNPMIRASVFVGQADTKSSAGMTQEIQQKTIRDFQSGIHNVIVATSIGEEGLDIGQVDLIVCYDSSASPIRMLQRMGRTGRKRAGHVVLLLMKGKEKDSFTKSKDNYEKVQKMICDGSRFNFRDDLSRRIVPKGVKPVVDKRDVEIPFENTQNNSLPEPKRRPRNAKKPAKKKVFQAPPSGAELGFVSGSNLLGPKKSARAPIKMVSELDVDQLMPVPPVESVFLSARDEDELVNKYQNVPGDELQEVCLPEFTLHPSSQRRLGGGSRRVGHGNATKRMVSMLNRIYIKENLVPSTSLGTDPPEFPTSFLTLSPPPKHQAIPILSNDSDLEGTPHSRKPTKARKKPPPRKRKIQTRTISDGDSCNSDDDLRSEPASDNGSDLIDFLADDNDVMIYDDKTDPLDIASDSESESVLPEAPDVVHVSSRPFFEPAHFIATQDTNDDDEEMPDVGTLLGKRKEPPRDRTSESTEQGASKQPVARGKRRRVVNSDSDED